MVAAQNYQYQQYAQPNPQHRRVSEEERRRRVAEKAAKLEQQHRREQAKRNALLKQQRQSRALAMRKLGIVGFVMLSFAMLALTVVGYSMVAGAKVAYNAAAAELQELEAQIVDLEIDAAVATDISTVEEKAAALGMGFPKDYQVIAIRKEGPVTAINNGSSDFGLQDLQASALGH